MSCHMIQWVVLLGYVPWYDMLCYQNCQNRSFLRFYIMSLQTINETSHPRGLFLKSFANYMRLCRNMFFVWLPHKLYITIKFCTCPDSTAVGHVQNFVVIKPEIFDLKLTQVFIFERKRCSETGQGLEQLCVYTLLFTYLPSHRQDSAGPIYWHS